MFFGDDRLNPQPHADIVNGRLWVSVTGNGDDGRDIRVWLELGRTPR